MINGTSLARLRETAPKLPKGTKTVTLTCRHTALYSGTAVPRPGEWAFCRTCDTARRVRKPRKTR